MQANSFVGGKRGNDWKHLSLSYTMLSVIFFEWQLYYFASFFAPEELANYISKKILQQVSTEKTSQILLGQPAAQRKRFIQQGEKKNLSKVLAARRISKARRRDALIAAQHSIQNRIAETVPAFYPNF